MACATDKYVGKMVKILYAWGERDTEPASPAWVEMPSMTTKSYAASWDGTDATTDDTPSYLDDEIGTSQSFEISGEGLCRADGAMADTLFELEQFFHSPSSKGCAAPFLWVRIVYPDTTFTTYARMTDFSRSGGGTKDVVSFSVGFKAVASDTGVKVEATSAIPVPSPSSVIINPTSLTLNNGTSYKLHAVVIPGFANQAVTWTVNDANLGSITQGGVVTAKAGTGTLIVTATTVDTPTKTKTLNITLAA